MNTITRMTGTVYTPDADYNEFLGAQYTRIIYDWTRRCWMRCTMQAPKMPKDTVPSADPDAAIADEPWERDRWGAARAAYKLKSEKLHAELESKLVAHLRKHGPQTVPVLRQATGTLNKMLRDHLNARDGTVYCRIIISERKQNWGLVGLHDQEAA